MAKPIPIENASQYQWLLGLNGDAGRTQRQGERQDTGSKRDIAYKTW
ncbi:hypothetical protein Q7O_001606 [Pectobacterium carotovorum subsp. carotovorum PCCS1]|nr:hypothetical protein [Pectobacterium carotovorum subsp. carotovorum PCCS1]